MWQYKLYANVHAAHEQLTEQRAAAGKRGAKNAAARKSALTAVAEGFKRLRKHPGWKLFERVSMTEDAKRTLAGWRRIGQR